MAMLSLELLTTATIAAHVAALAGALAVAAVADPAAAPAFPWADLSPLRFRERDMLEEVLRGWRKAGGGGDDAAALWDARVRSHLGTRYDARANVADWDYNMRLAGVAPTVHPRQYEAWRLTGVAFEPREADYTCPNPTLLDDMPGRDAKGARVLRHGYWGDITTGPYITFGVACEDPRMLKLVNGKPTKVGGTGPLRGHFSTSS
jgi:dynein assembly factor 3